MHAVADSPVLPPRAGADAPVASVGFKEWSVVCAALGSGRQSLILRKGGIAEGRNGFRFKHERFFLFPTQFHQQFEQVRADEGVAAEDTLVAAPDTIQVRLLMVLDFACWVEDLPTILRLEPWHIWRADVVRARFAYGEHPGLQCAFGRVYRVTPTWTFPNRPQYGGCRSWVTLPELPPDSSWSPVLADAAHARQRTEIQALLAHQ